MRRRIAYVSNDPVEAYKDGYAAGMEDARDAVASMDLPPNGPAAGLRAEALAAIDALREKP